MADDNSPPEIPEKPTDTPPGPQATPPVDSGAPTTPPAADASAETPPTDEGEDEQSKPKKRGGGFQDRIDKLTAQKRELERRLADVTTPKGADAAADDARPDRSKFADYEEWHRADTRWETRQEFNRIQRENAQREYARVSAERIGTLKTELAEAAAEDPAFAKAWKTVSADGFPVSDSMGEFIAESDNPTAVIEWLASNPAEAEKLYSASPAQVARALARVEAKQAQAPPARTPQAPPPPPTVGGRSTPRVDLAKLASNNTEEYIAKRREQMAKAH